MKRIMIVLTLWCLAMVAQAAPPADDTWISSLEGGWHGENNMTPMGRMPFVMLFEREEDGSLHSRSALNRETWIDIRFRQGPDGRIKRLSNVGGMQPAVGSGLQGASYELLDDSAEAHRATRYFVVDFDIFGRSTQHGPIGVDRGVRARPEGRRAR